jgi:hypothetical protein
MQILVYNLSKISFNRSLASKLFRFHLQHEIYLVHVVIINGAVFFWLYSS